ncbi:DUF3192 domain-containing protein [Psychrosphaera aestuarii]|uniref:DUF3192 domain-containing protein n=1 Tax=Psychrosphaera aestuarii TaxID=1266052 RepID=UPI001B322DC4|nr:DUF3192 domain-containing protein [Psychrosphaera aestuarii]
MKNSAFKLLIALPLALSMTGCIIVASDDGHDADWISSKSNSDSHWKEEQRVNNDKIASLQIGDEFEKVRGIMGTPKFNEAFESEGKSVQVIFYRTRHKHSDGETTKDECTPLIFKDGTLVGFGKKAYERL